MVDRAALQVMGEPPFHATHLTTSNRLSYIGGNWDQDVAFAGYSQPLRVRASIIVVEVFGRGPATGCDGDGMTLKEQTCSAGQT